MVESYRPRTEKAVARVQITSGIRQKMVNVCRSNRVAQESTAEDLPLKPKTLIYQTAQIRIP